MAKCECEAARRYVQKYGGQIYCYVCGQLVGLAENKSS